MHSPPYRLLSKSYRDEWSSDTAERSLSVANLNAIWNKAEEGGGGRVDFKTSKTRTVFRQCALETIDAISRYGEPGSNQNSSRALECLNDIYVSVTTNWKKLADAGVKLEVSHGRQLLWIEIHRVEMSSLRQENEMLRGQLGDLKDQLAEQAMLASTFGQQTSQFRHELEYLNAKNDEKSRKASTYPAFEIPLQVHALEKQQQGDASAPSVKEIMAFGRERSDARGSKLGKHDRPSSTILQRKGKEKQLPTPPMPTSPVRNSRTMMDLLDDSQGSYATDRPSFDPAPLDLISRLEAFILELTPTSKIGEEKPDSEESKGDYITTPGEKARLLQEVILQMQRSEDWYDGALVQLNKLHNDTTLFKLRNNTPSHDEQDLAIRLHRAWEEDHGAVVKRLLESGTRELANVERKHQDELAAALKKRKKRRESAAASTTTLGSSNTRFSIKRKELPSTHAGALVKMKAEYEKQIADLRRELNDCDDEYDELEKKANEMVAAAKREQDEAWRKRLEGVEFSF